MCFVGVIWSIVIFMTDILDLCVCLVTQSCLTLCDPMDCSSPGSSVYGISQVVLVVKNPPANAGDLRDEGSILGWGRTLGGGHSNPLQYSLPGESHGERSLVSYSP